MTDLWLGNVEASVPDDEIKAFLVKYGFPECDAIEHVSANGPRPAVRVSFKDATPESLRNLQPRIQNMFWKNHKINVQVMSGNYG